VFLRAVSLRLFGILAMAGLVPGPPANAAVDGICDKRFKVHHEGQSLDLAYCANLDLAVENALVTRAVIVVHGINRNADDYFASTEAAAVLADEAHLKTAIIAPQFLAEADIDHHALPLRMLFWGSGGWKKGNPSRGTIANPRRFSVSSFEVLDQILLRLADRADYPNMREIVVTGHSAGGQFTNRYAAGGAAEAMLAPTRPDLAFRYVVANPSSYLYFSAERAKAGTLDEFAAPGPERCTSYDEYHYGLKDLNSYMSAVGKSKLSQRYRSRRVVTLLGWNDDDPNHSSLAAGCSAMIQGRHRLERGQIYFNYIRQHFGDEIFARHRFEIVPGVGHSSRRMFQSGCGLRHLFDFDPQGRSCARKVVFADSFERGLGSWSQDSTDRWFGSSRRDSDGRRSAQIEGPVTDAALVSPKIDIEDGEEAAVGFSWYIERGLDAGEYLAFDISLDGGLHWTEKARLRGDDTRESSWQDAAIDIIGSESLMLRFRGRMSKPSEDANVDNIHVTIRDDPGRAAHRHRTEPPD
jgi:hypothetical protein